jgi:hypothetical protein
MFDDIGLAVSLPARELGQAALPGSVFEARHLAGAPISSELAAAIGLVQQACAQRGGRMLFIARPEIFIDPVTLAWLGERLGGIVHHLCISDGAAIRVIPRLHNHLFLYRLGLQANADAFGRLARRAPELLAGLETQVNTTFRFAVGATSASPRSVLLQPQDEAAPGRNGGLFRCYYTPGPIERCAEWILARGAVPADACAGFARASYLPLTEAALADRAFCDVLAGLVAGSYFDPAACLLLRLPVLPSPAASVADRLAAALAGLARAGGQVPRVPAPNVFFLADDLDAATAGTTMPIDLMMPDSFDFWRHSARFYSRFATAAVLIAAARRRERARLASLLGRALGQTPQLRWLRPDAIAA